MKYIKILLLLLVTIIPPISSASFDKDLYYGIDNDSQVLELQEFLTSEELYSGPITGNYYSLTVQAVKNFQERENIKPVAGYFGSLTREKANQVLSEDLGKKETQSISSNQTSGSSDLQSQIDNLLLIIKSLQEELTKQQTPITQIQTQASQSNTTTTLPNGSIVEIDSNGQIVRYIKEVQNQISETTNQNNSPSNTSVLESTPKISLSMINNSVQAKPSSQNLILSKFKVTTEETTESTKSILKLTLSNGNGKITDLSNFSFVDKNGSVVAGPVNPDSNGVLTFIDTITFPKGTMEYTLRANIGSNFSTEQWIYTTINTSDWALKTPEEKKVYVPPFQASEMGVFVSSQTNQIDSNGNYSVNLNLTSLTDLTSLSTKLINKENGSLYIQTPTRNVNNYQVSFTNIPSGNYDLKMIADAITLVGVIKTYTTGILVE
ncbi:peptidoglycan-binding protein [Patescibacteria group bacterium]|nr:peptidoglycan-binding protein [Patescibacteria group bacterium]